MLWKSRRDAKTAEKILKLKQLNEKNEKSTFASKAHRGSVESVPNQAFQYLKNWSCQQKVRILVSMSKNLRKVSTSIDLTSFLTICNFLYWHLSIWRVFLTMLKIDTFRNFLTHIVLTSFWQVIKVVIFEFFDSLCFDELFRNLKNRIFRVFLTHIARFDGIFTPVKKPWYFSRFSDISFWQLFRTIGSFPLFFISVTSWWWLAAEQVDVPQPQNSPANLAKAK